MTKIIAKILKEILEEEGNITGPGEATATPKIFKKVNEAPAPIKKGRRFVPNEFEFPEALLKPIRFSYAQDPKIYFKIATNAKGESVLMIDPLVKTALDSIERGRSSFTKEQSLGKLTLYLKERVSQQVRGLIKKYAENTKVLGNGFLSLPLIMSKSGDGWVIQNPNKTDVNKDMNVPLYESEVEETPEVTKAAERLVALLNKHGEFGASNNTSDSVLNAILHKRPVELAKWFEVSNASALPEDRNIENILMTWRNGAYNSFKQNSINESKLDKLIQNMVLKEASYGQFKKEVKFRTKNEMLHKGIKTVKSKLQEVDRIVEYMNRMKQELSENEEGVQYWDKTKQSINKIQELVETLNNKIKGL
jgi:hypothetical protein